MELEAEAAELCLIGTENGSGVWTGGAVAVAAVGILLLVARRKPRKPRDSGEQKGRIPEKV